MPTIQEILSGLGVPPPSNRPMRRAVGGRPGRDPIRARPRPQETRLNTRSSTYANAVDLNGTPGVSQALRDAKEKEGESGGGPLGVGNLFKKAGSTLLDVVDTGRAYTVSGVKELSDTITAAGPDSWQKNLDEPVHGSWKEFLDQGDRGIGFQEVLDKNTRMDGGWQRTALGIAGDAALDPTNLVIGPASTALRGGDALMTQAVREGSGRVIADTLSSRAAKVGLQADEGVQRLIVEANARGRGALTQKNLVKYGVSPETAQKLGLGKMVKTIGKDGPAIPGSARLADAGAGVSGSIKAAAKRGRTAKWARGTFVPQVMATREINQVVNDATKSFGQRAQAVASRAVINESKGEARQFASLAEKQFDHTVGSVMHGMDDGTAAQVAHAWESGLSDEVTDLIRPQMRAVMEEMQRVGVDVGDLGPDYMPHQIHDDFRKLSGNDIDVAKIITRLDDKVGMQNERLLHDGDELFGVKTNGLVSGPPTAAGRSLNDISMDLKGVKMFNDDPRVIIPKYVRQAGEAIGRARMMRALEDMGISRELSERSVKKAIAKTPDEVASLKAARKLQRMAEADEIVALQDGTTIRRGGLKAARDLVVSERKTNYAARKAAESKVVKLGRELASAQERAVSAVTRLESLEASKARWVKVASSSRAEARNRARSALGDVNRRIVAARNEAAMAKRLIDRIESPIAKNSLKGWNDEIARLDNVQEELIKRGEELQEHVTPLGEGDLLGDEVIRHLNTELEQQILRTNGHLKVEEIAGGSFSIAAADSKKVLQILDAAEQDLAKVWEAATKIPETASKRSKAIREENTEILRRMQVVREVLTESTSPVAQTLAKIEAAGFAADAAAARARVASVTFEEMVNALDSPKFLTETMKDVVDTGMVKLGEAHQIPGWLNDALKVQGVLRDVPGAKNFMGKAYNLWKGYAILRPGFQARNAYSATYNLYLDRGPGAIAQMKPMRKFLSIMDDGGPNFMEEATKVFGAAKAEKMRQATIAAYATGTGQAAGEFATSGMRRGGMENVNPLSKNNILLRANRDAGEYVERLIRSTHAFDVIASGGDVNMATRAVEKWHFNYTDLNNFDQYAKLVNPFWVFFSRNMALQAQTFTQVPAKLNRTYFNAQRNLGYGQPEDTDVPEYFKEAGAIRLPGGFPGSGGAENAVNYLFPDIPAVQAPGLFDQVTNPQDMRILGNVGPIPQIVGQHLAGQQLFSGIPFKGQVEANIGTRFLDKLSGGALTTPHGDTGDPMIDDEAQNVIGTLFPLLSTLDRLQATSDSGKEKETLSRVSWATGVGIRQNNARTRKGEKYRQLLEEQDADRYREQMGL